MLVNPECHLTVCNQDFTIPVLKIVKVFFTNLKNKDGCKC